MLSRRQLFKSAAAAAVLSAVPVWTTAEASRIAVEDYWVAIDARGRSAVELYEEIKQRVRRAS